MNGVSQSTISRINNRVTKLIVTLQSQFIRFPNKTEREANKVKFYERGKFPEVVGCVGSTHVGVRVKGAKDYNAGFVNENGYHSVKVQVGYHICAYGVFLICSVNYKFSNQKTNTFFLFLYGQLLVL